jgi:hypothetical protein
MGKVFNYMDKGGDILTKAGGLGAAIAPATGAAAPFVETGSAGAVALGAGLKERVKLGETFSNSS